MVLSQVWKFLQEEQTSEKNLAPSEMKTISLIVGFHQVLFTLNNRICCECIVVTQVNLLEGLKKKLGRCRVRTYNLGADQSAQVPAPFGPWGTALLQKFWKCRDVNLEIPDERLKSYLLARLSLPFDLDS